MRSDSSRQPPSIGPARPVITAPRLDRAIAEGRRLHGLAVRQAFATVGRFLGALSSRLAARLRNGGASGSCYRRAG